MEVLFCCVKVSSVWYGMISEMCKKINDSNFISLVRTPYLQIYEITFRTDVHEYVLLQEWNDMNLRWNSSEFGGVKDLRIPPHRLWKPDVLMYNR